MEMPGANANGIWLLAHLLGHSGIGAFDLLISWAGVTELIAGVGIVKIAPNCCHLQGDLKVAVLFCSDLRGRDGCREIIIIGD